MKSVLLSRTIFTAVYGFGFCAGIMLLLAGIGDPLKMLVGILCMALCVTMVIYAYLDMRKITWAYIETILKVTVYTIEATRRGKKTEADDE